MKSMTSPYTAMHSLLIIQDAFNQRHLQFKEKNNRYVKVINSLVIKFY